jgi:hypothetical protein
MAKPRRSWLRRVLGIGVLAGGAYAIWRAIEANRPEHEVGWEPQPFPFPPQPRANGGSAAHHNGERADESQTWLSPVDGACPESHPIKGKLASGIYHMPGGFSYDRTSPDRCYRDPASAESDGLRPSKR